MIGVVFVFALAAVVVARSWPRPAVPMERRSRALDALGRVHEQVTL